MSFLPAMDFASNSSGVRKREALASDSYVGQNYEASLLADIPGVPSNPNDWNNEDLQRWLRGCIDGYQLSAEDLPSILDMKIEDLLKGVNAAEFDKAFGDVCGDVIANDLLLRMQLADPKAKPTDGLQELVQRASCHSESTPRHAVNTGLPRAPSTHPHSIPVQQLPMRNFQPEMIPPNPFYPQPQFAPLQPAGLYDGHLIDPSSALGYPRGVLPSMSAFRDTLTFHNASQSPAEMKVFAYSNQMGGTEEQLRSPALSSSGSSEQFMSPRMTAAPVHFGGPLSCTQRSGSLMSVSSLDSNSPSDWTSEEETSPFVYSESDDPLTTRGGQLVDGALVNGSALPTITVSPQSSVDQFGRPFSQMPDGSGLVAIAINPKTGKPKRKRRKKIRGQIIPPPLLPNRSSCTLWEFFLELLAAPEHYSRLITWLEKEKGEFKIVDSEVVSIIWGLLKNKTGMKYDHMSRSIRYYYGKDILDKVPEKQLVYRFGVNSDWLSYQPKSQGVDESRMPKTPIQICGRVAKPKHFAVARVAPTVS